jgi:hypothetical protein
MAPRTSSAVPKMVQSMAVFKALAPSVIAKSIKMKMSKKERAGRIDSLEIYSLNSIIT